MSKGFPMGLMVNIGQVVLTWNLCETVPTWTICEQGVSNGIDGEYQPFPSIPKLLKVDVTIVPSVQNFLTLRIIVLALRIFKNCPTLHLYTQHSNTPHLYSTLQYSTSILHTLICLINLLNLPQSTPLDMVVMYWTGRINEPPE